MSFCHMLASDFCLSATFTGKLDDSEDVSVPFRLSMGDLVLKYFGALSETKIVEYINPI